MKQIPLRTYHGRIIAHAKVDDEDYDKLIGYKWHLSTDGYARRWCKSTGKPVAIRMHREITNAPSGLQVDHINRDTLDNQRGNLRMATSRQNAFNRKLGKNRKPGERIGVYYRKDKNLWRTFCVINGARKERSFTTKEKAIAHRKFIEETHYDGFAPVIL